MEVEALNGLLHQPNSSVRELRLIGKSTVARNRGRLDHVVSILLY